MLTLSLWQIDPPKGSQAQCLTRAPAAAKAMVSGRA